MSTIGRSHSHHKPKPVPPPPHPTSLPGDPPGTWRGKITRVVRDETGRITGAIEVEDVLLYGKQP